MSRFRTVSLFLVSALFVAGPLPRSSRADSISGSWQGVFSGYQEVTDNGQVVSYVPISSNGELSVSFVPAGFGQDQVFINIYVPYLNIILISESDIGPQSTSFYFNISGYYYDQEVDFFANYAEILDGTIYGPGSAALDVLSGEAEGYDQYHSILYDTEFLSFQGESTASLPEPSSLVMAGTAALIGFLWLSRRRYGALKNLVGPRRARG